MSIPKPHDSDYEDEVDPLTEEEATTARLDLLSAYTMHGRLELDGLLPSVTDTREEAARVVEPPAREDERYYYKEPSENTWRAA